MSQHPARGSADSNLASAGGSAYSPRYLKIAIWLLTIVYVVNFIDRQILAILLQAIKEDLGLADWQLGLLSGTAFGLFYATLGIPIARLADRWSRKWVIVSSLALWSAMTALCGAAAGFFSLLALRVGVGVGEAGCTPSSHSLISDYFPLERRGWAMGVYSLGVPIGILIGFMLGGWLEETFGWRRAFWVVGLPGLGLAVIVAWVLREPRRETQPIEAAEGQLEEPPKSSTTLGLAGVVGYLARIPSFRTLAVATALFSLVNYSMMSWTPSVLIRSYEMSTGVVGTWLALIIGLGGCVGTFAGGVLSDRWSVRDIRGRAWVPLVSMAISLPFLLMVYTAPTGQAALLWLIVPATAGLAIQAPVYSTIQSLATPGMRATAAALLLFTTNIMGLAIGPPLVGLISDWLAPRFGDHSLRWAMFILAWALLPSIFCYWAAARTLARDLERARHSAERESQGLPPLASEESIA
jgi:MFS family permease